MQFGYRAKRSTKLAATLLFDDIRREIDQGKLVGAVFVDLTKAFDTIGHSVLLNKFPSYGIKGNELTWFSDYLFNRSPLVDLNNVHSISEPIYNWVPQGSIIGPLLFIVFFNDIVRQLTYSKIIKYTEFSDRDVYVIENPLNKDLELISKYFDEN